jgi:hypothetical protein
MSAVTDNMTPWSQLVPGERVRGQGGLVWTIVSLQRDGDYVSPTLERREEGAGAPLQKSFTIKGSALVEVVGIADDLQTAVNLMKVHTSGEDEYRVFPGVVHYGTGALLAHLKIVHGVADLGDPEKVVTTHLKLHAAGGAEGIAGAKPHRHDPRLSVVGAKVAA